MRINDRGYDCENNNCYVVFVVMVMMIIMWR